MKRITLIGTSLAAFGCASFAVGGSPLHVDRPTPPPCAADGTCYPNENTWGWYPCHWRQWPGEVLAPTPAGAQPTPAEGPGGQLKPYETPSPEQEDAQAPPSTKTSAAPEAVPAAPPAEGGAPARTSAAPGAPPEPVRPPQTTPATPHTTPNYPTPNYPTPNRPTPGASSGARPSTTDNDPPPSLPWQVSSSRRRAAMADAAPRTDVQQHPTAPHQPAGNDPPPSLPSVFHSAAL